MKELTPNLLNYQAAELLEKLFHVRLPVKQNPFFLLVENLLAPDGLLELPPGAWKLNHNRYQEWTDLAQSNPAGLLSEVVEFLNQTDPSFPTSKSLPEARQWAARLLEGVQSQLPNKFPQEAIDA